MIKHRLRGLSTILGNQVDLEKIEELKRNKTDIENNLSKILKLIKNEDQSSKREGKSKETELVGLIEDFFTQYQPLYALYDRLIGDNGKIVSRRIERRASASLSSSSSDSDYFSSDEVDGNNRRHLSENEHHNIASDPGGEKRYNEPEIDVQTRAISAREKELEEQFNCQKKDLESLTQQKSQIQLQNESKASEAEKLSAKITELEVLVKTKEDEVSGLQGKLEGYESEGRSTITELMAQINTLTLEAKTLRTQKDEMEAKLTLGRDEALSRLEGLRDQLNVMHQNLDSLSDKNKELEAQMEENKDRISQYLVQIEYLNEQLVEKVSVEHGMREEKEGLVGRVKDLELELESRCKQQNELEEELREKSCEIKQLGDENKALQDRNVELKRAMTHTGEELNALAKERESTGNGGAEIQAMALSAQFDDLRLELDYFKEEKIRLELQNERIQKEYSESLAKIFDQGKIIKEQAETIDRISGECEESKMWFRKFKSNRQFSEKRIEELAEEVRGQLEDSIRLVYQRIRVAEQLHSENKDSYKLAKERYEQETRMLKEKIAIYEDEVTGVGVTKLKPIEVLNGLDLAAGKLEEHQVSFLSRVSKMMEEVQNARDWIKERKEEMKQLKANADHLTALLDDKEEQEVLLRERVWRLEAKVSKEGGEKLNLMKSVTQLEKKVGRLEKSLKEKDEELVNLGETKREAIRQLCFLNDYHRNRCDYLRGLFSNIRVKNRTITRA